jgi:vanillate/3-O-methylgallate O-demethylase
MSEKRKNATMELDINKMREGVRITRSWEPLEYTGWQDENISWHEECYIGDWSQMVEYHVSGPDALKFFSDFAVNNFMKFEIRQAKHIIFPNKKGHIIGEGILIRFGEDEFEFQSGGPVWSWVDYNCKKGDYNVASEKADKRFKFQVSGPKALYLLEKITGKSLRDIRFMHVGEAEIQGVKVDMLRQGMAGEIGFEIQGLKEAGRMIYQYIFEHGKEFNIRRIGGRTAMVNHMEACFPTVVHDYLPALTEEAEQDYWEAYKGKFDNFKRFFKIAGSFEAEDVTDWYRNPYELGWGGRINYEHGFYGKEALWAIKDSPKTRKIVTLVWEKEDVIDVLSSTIRDSEPYTYMELPRTQWYCNDASKVVEGDKVIGIATNRCFSYYFREMISHCSIDPEYAKIGKKVTVVWGNPGGRQKLIRATVAQSPYKTDHRKEDLTALPKSIK